MGRKNKKKNVPSEDKFYCFAFLKIIFKKIVSLGEKYIFSTPYIFQRLFADCLTTQDRKSLN